MVTIEPLPLCPTGGNVPSSLHHQMGGNRTPWRTVQWSNGPWSAHCEDTPNINQWNRRFLPQSKRTPTPKSSMHKGGLISTHLDKDQGQDSNDLLKGVMRINATDVPHRQNDVGTDGRMWAGDSLTASFSENGMRHETSPRDPILDHYQENNPNLNPKFDTQNTSPNLVISVKKKYSSEGGAHLRGSELLIANQYEGLKASPRALTTPTLQTISPFHEHAAPGPTTGTTHRGREWEKSSANRNMAGTQQHYMVYLRDLRRKQDWDLANQSKRVDSSIQRFQQTRQSRTIKSAFAWAHHNHNLPNTSKKGAESAAGYRFHPPQMCAVNENWDVRQSQAAQANTATVGSGADGGTHGSSPMAISKRKNEFSKELSFVQQVRNKQPNIRTSVTPRTDEGVLDWLLRSVTSVPLDSKYAPRSTNRLFKLSVHALQNRITSSSDVTSSGGGVQGHDTYVDSRSGASTSMSSAHGLYIDPNIRAQTAEASQRRSRISPRSFTPRGGTRTVKSAGAAAGRLSINSEESTEERVESSRRLWTAHHQNNYNRRKTMPQVKESDLAFSSDVMKEYLSPRVCPDPPSLPGDDHPEGHIGIEIHLEDEVPTALVDTPIMSSGQEADVIREAARVTNTPTGGLVQSDVEIQSKLRSGKEDTKIANDVQQWN